MAEPPVETGIGLFPFLGGLFVSGRRDNHFLADQFIIGPIGGEGHFIVCGNLQAFNHPQDLVDIPPQFLRVIKDGPDDPFRIDDKDRPDSVGSLAGVDQTEFFSRLRRCRRLPPGKRSPPSNGL